MNESSLASSSSAPSTLAADPGVRQRVLSIFGGSVGNLIEWYDFYMRISFAV